MSLSSTPSRSIFDYENPDPEDFWGGETFNKPENLDYEGLVYTKAKSKLKAFTQKWLGLKGSILYFGEVYLYFQS